MRPSEQAPLLLEGLDLIRCGHLALLAQPREGVHLALQRHLSRPRAHPGPLNTITRPRRRSRQSAQYILTTDQSDAGSA
eukprot:6966974-Pyramimonas_sp.AAC.1